MSKCQDEFSAPCIFYIQKNRQFEIRFSLKHQNMGCKNSPQHFAYSRDKIESSPLLEIHHVLSPAAPFYSYPPPKIFISKALIKTGQGCKLFIKSSSQLISTRREIFPSFDLEEGARLRAFFKGISGVIW